MCYFLLSSLGSRDSFVIHTHTKQMTHQRKTQNEENNTQMKDTSKKGTRWTMEDNWVEDVKDETILYFFMTMNSSCSTRWIK